MVTTSAAGSSAPVSYQTTMPSEAAERSLLERIRDGDREAAEALVDATYAMVFASLVRLCASDRELASDLTQEAYRKAWEALPAFDSRARFSTWLYRIAYNTFLNHARRPLRAVPLETDGAALAEDPSGGAEEALWRREARREVHRAVLALPDELRFTVTARFWAGHSVSDIAVEEGVSSVAIRKRLRRALAILQAALDGVVR